MNNKILGLIFLALLLLFLASRFFSGNKNKSFDADVLQIDKERVTRLAITTKGSEPYTLEKEGANWIGKKGDLQITPEPRAIESTLDMLASLKVLRIATKDEGKWGNFEVDPENSKANIKVYNGSKLIKEYVVGGFKFDQQARTAKSYLRLADDKEVYVLDGFSSMSLGQGFDAYRNKKIVDLDAASISGVSWSSAAGNQSIEKTMAGWQGNDGELLDSTKVSGLLNGLTGLSAGGFIDNYAAAMETGNAATIQIQTAGQPVQLAIKEVTQAAKPLVLISSAKPNTYFAMDSVSVIDRFFKPLTEYQLDAPSTD